MGSLKRLSGGVDAGGEVGINHAFIIDGAENSLKSKKLNLAAELRSGERLMQIYTTQPALVMYTGNCLPTSTAENSPHKPYAAMLLETS
jgi:hypothetical protein